MTQEIVKREETALTFSGEQIRLIKELLAPDLDDNELALFIQTAKHKSLDPFKNQIYAVKRYDKRIGKAKMTIQTGIDGYRTVVARSGRYRGQGPIMWCGPDGKWVDVWLKKDPPAAAKATVYMDGYLEPVVCVATWDQYAQQYYKDGKWHTSPMWVKMGALMLGKCAEALALRKAAPDELAGIYTNEEMMQADEAEPKQIPATKEEKKVDKLREVMKETVKQQQPDITKDWGQDWGKQEEPPQDDVPPRYSGFSYSRSSSPTDDDAPVEAAPEPEPVPKPIRKKSPYWVKAFTKGGREYKYIFAREGEHFSKELLLELGFEKKQKAWGKAYDEETEKLCYDQYEAVESKKTKEAPAEDKLADPFDVEILRNKVAEMGLSQAQKDVLVENIPADRRGDTTKWTKGDVKKLNGLLGKPARTEPF